MFAEQLVAGVTITMPLQGCQIIQLKQLLGTTSRFHDLIRHQGCRSRYYFLLAMRLDVSIKDPSLRVTHLRRHYSRIRPITRLEDEVSFVGHCALLTCLREMFLVYYGPFEALQVDILVVSPS